MFTEPDDLDAALLRDALRSGWGFDATSVAYQPVGFGSYHWLATNEADDRLFASVDDLSANLRTAQETTDASFGRLAQAFATASSLHDDAGLTFVIAPTRAADGQVLHRLNERYTLVVHPFVVGDSADENGDFRSDDDRRSVLDMVVQVHGVRTAAPVVDDFVVPHLDTLRTLLDETAEPWDSGPYAERARALLTVHAGTLDVLFAAYDRWVARVSARPERMVVTHGEPHARNIMRTAAGLVMIDWDTTLLAPPERDLWDLSCGDRSLLDAYAAATGVDVDPDALALYELWWDLTEIAGYLRGFRAPHRETRDMAESWNNLRHYLRPVERWPDLYASPVPEIGRPGLR